MPPPPDLSVPADLSLPLDPLAQGALARTWVLTQPPVQHPLAQVAPFTCCTPRPHPKQVHLLGKSFAHALVKTVKLWERPTPYELIKQLEVVREKLPEIYDSGTTLNIWLERESSTPG